ncbi:Uncharacterised protein [Serratia fonticola]|nr:Uncharacterised protein [Serratia fonticola]CAI1112641.1 Uncharacterised protein [Serratia fonticola]CAI1117515.1 Uncharacterised protein [Serratia fonticola]CAI1737713.1 Uncharacterised protein [Serratia fonticola]
MKNLALTVNFMRHRDLFAFHYSTLVNVGPTYFL